MTDYNPFLERLVRLSLEEDLGAGDVTTDAVVPPEKTGQATLIARKDMVLAGMFVFRHVFICLDPDMGFEPFFKDGNTIPAGKPVCRMTGRLNAILKGERTALNFLQRMSGIASLTRRYVEKVGASKAKVLDTRKTVPGHRWLDKYAVRTGGGANHRFNLSDGVLIKDNHIAAAGSIQSAVEMAQKKAPHTVKIEVEVEDLAGVASALTAGADIILLDNMDPPQLREAVQMVEGRALIEASGGITLDTVANVAAAGVDYISVGALTHSPKAADLSLEIMPT